MYVVDICLNYTMQLPLQILPLLAADFDGDVLNILLLINKDFIRMAERILNPKNSLYISRNDGKMNNAVNHSKDTLININALLSIGRQYYTKEDVSQIMYLKSLTS